MKTIQTDVFVVGAGPTGLSCAALLARQGVKVLAITRYSGLANSPRAHITNQRTMEVLRDLGIEERVLAAAMPGKMMGQVVWATSFAGTELARRKSWGASAARLSDYALASPSDLCNVHQHVLEPILCDAAREFGADVRFSLELMSMEQNERGVRSLCRDRVTGEEVEVLSQYAIGADGDNSVVCREIGFEVEGQMALGHMLNYWIKADLAPWTAHRPGALYQIIQPGAGIAVFVNVAPWDEWVMSMPYNPADGEPDTSDAAATQLARQFVGDDSLQVEVELVSTSKWTINQVFATQMHKGRVMIAGNAAHRHPPAGGLGANTCIQDAYNLCWKLALVLRGQAGSALLHSYNDERQPVAKQIVLRANQSMKSLFALPQAFGLHPGQPEADAWNAIHGMFSAEGNGTERREQLHKALAMQDFNFNAIGVELGQRYASSAIAGDGSHVEPTRDPELYYEPSSSPGSPLPHAWLARGTQNISTLDLAGQDGFTVITGIGGERWIEAARNAADKLGIAINGVRIGLGPKVDAQDVYGDWAALREIGESGCLLVRPDRHIAFRAMCAVDDPEAVLTAALVQILAR
ncbi:FAD-dependent monooxygenase [Diaphorobacter sp. HDW4B]|uniref:FAD-dependent monooxygenase n=1 Tax=Diaphorobacter sp. HDW4B TaxID=2714925 RepID=UPI001F1032BC|nr:FAD-dependent monooxygenase [Diaphorobacter sp. HDW4B]